VFDLIRSGGCPELRSLRVDHQDHPTLNGLLLANGRLRLETLGLTEGWEVPWEEVLAAGTVKELTVKYYRSPSRFIGALRRIGGHELKRFRLVLNDLDPHWESVADHSVFEQLDLFELVLEQPTLAGVQALANWPLLDRVHRIRLATEPRQGQHDLAPILESPRLNRLTHFHAPQTRFGVETAEALTGNPSARRLRSLSVGRVDAIGAVFKLLAHGEPFPDLHTFQFDHSGMGLTAGVRELLDNTALPRLAVVFSTFEDRLLRSVSEVLAARLSTPWFGGVVWDGGDGGRFCESRFGAYLPHHLDDAPSLD
jgi:hypothetical protein